MRRSSLKVSIRKMPDIFIDPIGVPSILRGPFSFALCCMVSAHQVGGRVPGQLRQRAERAANGAKPVHDPAGGSLSVRLGTAQTSSVVTNPATDM